MGGWVGGWVGELYLVVDVLELLGLGLAEAGDHVLDGGHPHLVEFDL